MTKISDIIRELEEVKTIHGDIDVLARTSRGEQLEANVRLSRHPAASKGKGAARVVVVEADIP